MDSPLPPPPPPLRCCICLLEDDDVWPLCCEGGAIHPATCAFRYARAQRTDDEADHNRLPIRCPACRRPYDDEALREILPARRLLRCEGTFCPLDDLSDFRVCVYEWNAGAWFHRLDFPIGTSRELPESRIHVAPVSEYFDLYNNNNNMCDPVFRVSKNRTDASTQTFASVPPPPPPPVVSVRDDVKETLNSLSRLRETSRRQLSSSITASVARETSVSAALAAATAGSTPRARRFRVRQMKKINEHVAEAFRHIDAVNTELLSL